MISIDKARGYYDDNDAVHDFDHVLRVLALAERIGQAEGADMEIVRAAALLHDVAAHRFRADSAPETLEAQVLFDADKLDAIGAVGIARAFAYGGAHGQRLWVPIESVDAARWQEEGDDPDTHTPVHEFVVKLSQLKGRLFTPTGRAIAEERHAYMVGFFERLDAEVWGQQ
jgi:uncharacterized protein